MKVTVSFNTIKIVVPCGDGELTVRELTQLATTRYKKATGRPRLSWVSVHSLKAKEGGILDPDDRLVDVCDDREQLIAFYDEEGIPQGGDGMSASSDESESISGYNKNDIEVNSDQGCGILQVRRGSEPALHRIPSSSSQDGGFYDEPSKRWSAAVMSRDIRSSKNDLSVIDEASFYSESNFDPGGKRSPLPPPFERGRGSGAARDSDRPTPFSRDSNRLSIQIGHEEGHWLEAAEKASHARSLSNLQQQEAVNPASLPKQRSSIDAKIEMFENASQRQEPLGGTSPPQHSKYNDDNVLNIVIHNEIGPLGIHVVPSGDPASPGLLIQGIEPGGRIDRDGRLAVNDRIIEINGCALIDLPFNKAQEIFKEALFAKDLQLIVDKSLQNFDSDQKKHNDYFMSDENKENIDNESEGFGTLGKKYAPGSKLTSAVQAANTRKIGKKIIISLLKGPHGLGFSITTRDIQSGGVAPIYIKHILSKGAAIENGQLKPGDRLLEINQQSVDGKSQSEVVAILRNIPQQAQVKLVVSRQEIVEEMEQTNTLERKEKTAHPLSAKSSYSGLEEKDNSSKSSTVPNSEESEDFSSISPDLQMNQSGEVVFPWKHREILTLDIPVHDTERAGLGVSVKGKTTGGGAKGIVDLGIFVKNVINGGAASRDGRLKTNDQLVNINGISLLGKANCDAMDTLRRAMHEEGPTPGVITLTVARRLNVSDTGQRLKLNGRESVTSMMTSSSGDDSYREYRLGQDSMNRSSFNNSSLNDTSASSHNNTVIYVEKPRPVSVFDNFIAPAVPRNPVVDRLMGRKEKPVDGLRNESYYRATGHDTFNSTMLQQHMDTTDNGKLQSPTVHQISGETVMIEQYPDRGQEKGPQVSNNRPHSPEGCEGTSEKDSDTTATDVAYASQTSLEETSFAFARDQPGRQSMSEKRHATLDAKSTDTYQRSKRARQEREKEQDPSIIGPMLGMKKSSSLESLQTMVTEMKMESGKQANRVKTSRVVRGRGCNESFRAAVDRSYEAQETDDNQEAEMIEAFDRGDYRQSGSSLDSNAEKKKKNQKLFKGFGMFKFGKQRAKSTDAMRSSGRKTPTNVPEPSSNRHTPTGELDRRDDEAREKMIHEQAKIQQHYKRLLQQRQEKESHEVNRKEERTEAVYSGEPALPASLAQARPGSRSGISGTPSDPRFANYEEIQRHLNRRQAQYHSQRREHPSRSERPVSNFYEYESVQSAINHGRQHSGGGGGGSAFHHPAVSSQFKGRTEFSPPRNSGRRQQTSRTYLPKEGPPLSVAPLPSKYGGQFLGHGDYDEYRGGEMEDPYARVLYAQDRNKRFLNSQSASRIQSHQVPNQNMYAPALPPGSKV